MGLAQEYTQEWLGFWMFAAQRAQDDWFRAAQAIRERKYGITDIVGDVASYWTDVAVASMTAWRGQDRKPAIVIFDVDVDDDAHAEETIPLLTRGLPYLDADVVWLGPVGPAPKGLAITADHIQIDYRKPQQELAIQLGGWKDKAGPNAKLAPATYRAIIRIGDVPVAEVIIAVEEHRAMGGAVTATRKRKRKQKGR